MTHLPQRPTGGVLTVVALYAVFAGLWILLSDQALRLLFKDPETLVRASTLKGGFFVVVTSLLLYGLVRRLANELVAAHERELTLERGRHQPPPMLVAIAEGSADAIFAKDVEGHYVLFNQAAARIVGQPAEQVLGHDDRALFPPEQAARIMAADQQVRASGQTQINEEVLETANGPRVFLVTKGPLRGDDGQIFGTYGLSRDITELKRAEREQRLLAEDMATTLQAIPDLLFELDAQGRYVKVKATNAALLAAPAEQVLGRTVAEVLPPAAAQTVMDALAAARLAGSDYGRTITLPLASGARHFELSVASKPAVQGDLDRFIVLSRDITERQTAAAELRQRNEELERFNRAAIDRELRMVALKQQVNALARAAGQPEPYDLRFAEAPGTEAAR